MIPADILRLLRQSWAAGNIDQFAEELFALLQTSTPLAHQGQLVLTQLDNKPALVIQNQSGDGNRVIEFQDGQGNDVGGITVGGASKTRGSPGGITIGTVDQGPGSVGRNDLLGVNYATRSPPTSAGGRNGGASPLVIDYSLGQGATLLATGAVIGGTVVKPTALSGGGGGGGVPCQVQSGTGAVYACLVYPNGITSTPVAASVQQLQIDNADTIPAGTWAIASLGPDGKYTMQCPVWL